MGQLIAVTGNSGKTVFSYYLAKILSGQGRRVFLVSTDSGQPAYKMLFPGRKNDDQRSLGRLLSLASISEAQIFDNAFTVNKDLMMLSYADGENPLTYPEVAEVNLRELFTQLSAIADNVIVDTATYPDAIDRYVLAGNPRRICIATADVKGYYHRRNHPAKGGETQVLFENSPDNAMTDVLGTYDGPVTVLPYSRGLSGIYNGVSIADIIPPRKYRKIVAGIAGELL